MRAEFSVGDDDVDAGVLQDESDFVRFEEIIDGHDDSTGGQDAEESRHELRTILQPKADAVAGLDGELVLELSSDGLGLVEQGGVGKLALARIYGGFIGSL